MAVAYVITIQGKPGKLLVEKCHSLAVLVGPLLGKLKAGFDVTMANGTVVRLKVMGEPSRTKQ